MYVCVCCIWFSRMNMLFFIVNAIHDDNDSCSDTFICQCNNVNNNCFDDNRFVILLSVKRFNVIWFSYCSFSS